MGDTFGTKWILGGERRQFGRIVELSEFGKSY